CTVACLHGGSKRVHGVLLQMADPGRCPERHDVGCEHDGRGPSTQCPRVERTASTGHSCPLHGQHQTDIREGMSMAIDYKKLGAEVAKTGRDMTKAETGGGGDYTPPAAGPTRLRFVAYVELGKQKTTY